MKFIKGTLALALTGLLAACGGGGSDGYYNNAGSSGGNNNGEPTTPTDPGTPSEAQSTLNDLKKEGQFLFGNYDPTDATTAKGYIDHAIDTFAQGPLQLATDAKKLLTQNSGAFQYKTKCFDGEGNQIYENTPCYILSGDQNIKDFLNALHPDQPGFYNNWKFKVTKAELDALKATPEQVEKFTGEAFLIIMGNQNADKAFNDIWVAGVFSYPYQQSWGLIQSQQLRIVSMNGEGQYNITVSSQQNNPTTGLPETVDKTYGALSIFKDSKQSTTTEDFYILQNNSSFDILLNDNPSTPDVEPVSFTINSVPGDSTSAATYRINNTGYQILNIPSVSAISGNRVENGTASTNTQSFTGSIYMEGNNIFQFRKSANGSILKFKHKFNDITFEGQSVNNGGTIKTTLTQPSGVTY